MSRHRYTEQELIRIMRSAKKALRRIPTIRDFDHNRVPGMKTPGSFTYKARFGSWSKALKAAFGVHAAYAQSTGLADDEKLREDMKALYAKLGRAPTAKEMSSEPDMHHANTYIRHYGSWKRAVGSILVPF